MSIVQEQLLKRNLAKPEGHFGKKLGHFMAMENYEVNTWAIQLLDIQATDHILEIGFGLGLAIRDMASLAINGKIVGLDHSEVMVKEAQNLNKDKIQQGQVELQLGDVSEVPSFEETFDKILAVNNVMYWRNHVETLKKLKNALNPGGRISLVVERPELILNEKKCVSEIALYQRLLQDAGFNNVEVIINLLPLKRPNRQQYVMAAISIQGINGLALPAITNDLDFEMLFQDSKYSLGVTPPTETMPLQQEIS